MSAFFAILQRDLRLAFRRSADLLNPILFYLIVVTLVPLALEPDAELLRQLAPGMIWIGALLASLMAAEVLFRGDYDDGTLELLLLSPSSPVLLISARLIAQWLLTGAPVVLMTPVLGLMMGLSGEPLWMLCLTLLIGTPILTLFAAIGVALTVGLQRGGALLSLLILPLLIPVLIFGSGAVLQTADGLNAIGTVYLLAALLVLTLTLAPMAIVAALKISLE